MRRKEFEEVFLEYIEDGFRFIDLELTKDRVVSFDSEKQSYTIDDTSVSFTRDGLTETVAYDSIVSIAI